jgi:hypothetical protein
MTGPAHTNTTTAAEIIRAHEVSEKRTVTDSKIVYDKVCEACGAELPWDDWRDALAKHRADMLAAAGLLADPTTRTEWGVACDIHDEVSEAEDREDAERVKAHHDAGMDHGHTIVRRTVTDWTPAEEGE